MPRKGISPQAAKERARTALAKLSQEGLREVTLADLGIKNLSKQAFGKLRKELLNGHTDLPMAAQPQGLDKDDVIELVTIAAQAAKDAGGISNLQLGLRILEAAHDNS